MHQTAFVNSLSITKEIIKVNEVVEEDSLIAEPWVLEGFPSCRPLSWVVIQHLKQQTLSILADRHHILLFAC
jgi:hypothetical protein